THEEPPRLRALDPTIPRDLETVVHKAIEREPTRRYGDAGALAEDLRRVGGGRPVRARRGKGPGAAWGGGGAGPPAGGGGGGRRRAGDPGAAGGGGGEAGQCGGAGP